MLVHTFAIRDLPASASDRACLRHVRAKVRPEYRTAFQYRALRHALLRGSLAAHHANQRLLQEFRL